MWVYLYMCCCFLIYPCFSHHYDHEEFFLDGGPYGVTAYRLLANKYDRNTAYDICRLYGGNIIRLDSFEKMLHVNHINDQEWAGELRHDYWIDLIHDTDNDEFIWTSDCTVLDTSNEWHRIISNFDNNNDKKCMVVKNGGHWNSKECSNDAMVLCETFESGVSCPFGSRVEVPLQSVGGSEAECRAACAADPSCRAYSFVTLISPSCTLMFDSGKQEDPSYVISATATKNCYKGEWVEDIDSSWSVGSNYGVTPVYNCTANTTSYLPQTPLYITNTMDTCSTMIVTEFVSLTVIDTTTDAVTVFITASPTTAVATKEIPTTVVMTTTEVPSPVVTTIVSTEVAITTVEIPTTIATTTVVPASNVTVTITPSIVPTTTVVSYDVVTATAEVPTTVVITETPSVIVSTVSVTVATTSTVIIPTTVVSSEVATHPTTVVVTTTVAATTWSSVPPLAPAALAEKMESMVKNLTVPKKNTNAYRRTLVCAEDDRQSATTVGFIGLLVVVVPLAFLLCLDLSYAVNCIRKLRKASK